MLVFVWCGWSTGHLQWQRLYVSPPLSDRKSIELFGAIYWGFSAINSATETMKYLTRGWQRRYTPLTVFHKVVIVGSHSYKEMVKPKTAQSEWSWEGLQDTHYTLCRCPAWTGMGRNQGHRRIWLPVCISWWCKWERTDNVYISTHSTRQ